MLVATQEGLYAAVAFGFLAGGAAVYLARALGRLIDRWADNSDPLDDPKNWH